MKIQIATPFSAEKAVGETEQHYGVPFTVVETSSLKAILVADIPEEEAQAMIDAGRVTAVDNSAAEAAQAEADRLAAEAAQAEADKAKGKK